MRGKKLAFIFTDTKPGSYYFQLQNGLFESFNYLTRNFEVMVFAYSDQLNVVRRQNFDINLRNTDKSVSYGVNQYFEPTHAFFVSDVDFDFEKIPLPKKTPKYLIHKGTKHKEELFDYFDGVIVETLEEKENYKRSVSSAVVNTKSYYPQITEKYFTFCFPQDLTASRLEFFSKVRVYGSISQTLNSTVKLPLESTETLATVINQSKAMSLIENTNDSFELALSALACNVPVLATTDSKASKIPAVVKSLATTPEFTIAMLEALNLEKKYNFREDYILPNFTPKAYSKVIMDMIYE